MGMAETGKGNVEHGYTDARCIFPVFFASV